MPKGNGPPVGNFQKPAIRTWGWGMNYDIDKAGNKINRNPDIDYYYDAQGSKQWFGKPQIDWSKVSFGQNPFDTPEALLGKETILMQRPPGTFGGAMPTAQPTAEGQQIPTANIPTTQFPRQPTGIMKPPSTGFGIGSSNYQMWKGALGDISLPSSIFAQNRFSGMTTGWDNPYYKNLFKPK